jgi:tetratricopeptide (TPR) repeat protein
MYLQRGERAKADALFAAAFARSRDKQTVFAARNLLVRFETDRASALSKSGKLDEAAAIVRRLAGETPDARVRRELEQQADQLAATAAVNRHIEMYNRAVAASNAGQKREAVKIVDELLRVATDPEVVRDAQRLRSELRKR